MKSEIFIKKAKDICDVKTVYAQGTSGQFLTKANKLKISSSSPFNSTRSAKIFAAGEDEMAFDELGLVSYLSNKNFKNYGQLFEQCTDILKDFSAIVPGEIVFMPERAGIYIGNDQVITASLDGVGITTIKGWVSHAKLKSVDYSVEEIKSEPVVEVAPESKEEKTDGSKQESRVVIRGDKFRNRH